MSRLRAPLGAAGRSVAHLPGRIGSPRSRRQQGLDEASARALVARYGYTIR
jgi:hypothetical protein